MVFDRERDTFNSYNYYKYILGNIGYVLPSLFFQEYKTSEETVYMDQAVMQSLAAIATGGQSAVVAETLNALKGMAVSDNRILLFSQQSSDSSYGNFQVYPCEQAPDGGVSMALGAFYFSASHHEVRYLFFGWESSNAHIYKGVQKTMLNETMYARIRSDISAKLGYNALNLVASIDLL